MKSDRTQRAEGGASAKTTRPSTAIALSALLLLGSAATATGAAAGDLPAPTTAVTLPPLHLLPSLPTAKRPLVVVAKAPPVVSKVVPATTPALAAERLNKLVSLDFTEASVSDVVKSIAIQSGINIVLVNDKDKAGSLITVSLKRVMVRDALDMVARLSGYRYVLVGSTFVVGTGAGIAAFSRDASIQNVATKAVPFIFSDPTKLLDSVRASFPNINVSLVLVGASSSAVSTQGQSGTATPESGGGAAETSRQIAAGGEAVTETRNGPTTDTARAGTYAEGYPTANGGSGSDSYSSIARVVPKGGVLNIVGSADEVEAVQEFVKNTEDALLESSNRDAEDMVRRTQKRSELLSQAYASYIMESYKIRYASPQDLVKLLGRIVPTLSVYYGPVQVFTTGSSGASTTYSQTQQTQTRTGESTGAAAGTGASSATTTVTNSSHAAIPSTLLLNGTAEDVKRAKSLLAEIDISVPQLQFEARVVDVQNLDSSQLGLRYDFSQTDYVGERHVTAEPSVGNSNALARRAGFGGIARAPYAIGVTLDALANNNHARTLASPNLSALDGEPATAFIGDQIRFVSNVTQGTNGPNIITDTASVGITLKVTGKYSPDGSITLYVHPEVSTVTSYITLTNGVSLPQISTRYVDTTIRVKNGETIAIGGLIQEQDVKNIQKVPVLGDLPFFGQLFRSTTTQKNRSNVVVFITSHVLKD